MPPKAVTLAAFLPAQLKPSEQAPEPAQQLSNAGQPRPQRCRCEGPYDLCWRYPAGIPNAVCKPTWDRLLAPFQFKGREWTIVELRSLWPHTVQALNERLMKGRMERTLKDDLQDDLQVLVDLIQHSCKPHPRPPRAGMKTLIVQGRILAEAIAQDALFQLDPSDPSAPRPDRDLVDLINRLREHHPASLLAPALHVLRCLGNTAVHLDRDSARLADGEIGDAAAVCCRLVVLVVDAYMHMCANLHRHEQTQEALAQPLLETPAAPIPAPNVLLRQREPTPPRQQPQQPPAEEAAPVDASPVAPPAAALPPPTAALAPPRPSSLHVTPLPERVLFGRRSGPIDAGGSSGENEGLAPPPAGGDGGSSGGGARRGASSGGGSAGRRSADGTGRAPYSLTSCDRSAVQYHAHAAAAAASGRSRGGSSSGSGGCSSPTDTRQDRPPASRGWWPSAAVGEAPLAPLLPTPTCLLRRTSGAGAGAQGLPTGLTTAEAGPPPPAAQLPPPAQLHRHRDASASYLVQEAYWSAPAGPGAAALDSTAPYICAAAAASSSFTASGGGDGAAATVVAAAAALVPAGQADPWVSGRTCQHPAGVPGSPGQSSISFPNGDANGNGNGYGAVTSWSLPVHSGSPPPASHPHPPLHHQLYQHHQQQGQQQQQQQQQSVTTSLSGVAGQGQGQGQGTEPGGGGGGSGGGGSGSGAAAAVLPPLEASKRLLQLCAQPQAPPRSKVARLLQAGATMGFTDKSGMTALHMACYYCHADAARLLLAAQPLAAASSDREGRTPLWVAAQRGHTELAEGLLGLPEGAGQVDVANTAGVTPLRVAAAQGHSGVVGALLRAGANVDAADRDGFTPLYVSAARSQLEVVRLLLGAGAQVDRPDKAGRSALWAALHPGGAAKATAEACPERRAAVVRALLAAGADVYLLADPRDRDYCWQLLAQSIAAEE
ncbi:hypothetical protein PLESTM_001092100 [Pleodorina starrii]|nr:hypothetical protein PLESTM_001092100 [Pleodorina starrii]